MRFADFEHVIRAAADAVGLDEFVIIGSQAIHGEITDPPEELLESMEVDMYPLADPAKADLIDGALGDGSWFEYTNGYFAHGVGQRPRRRPPDGWTGSFGWTSSPRCPGAIPSPTAWNARHDPRQACSRGGMRRRIREGRRKCWPRRGRRPPATHPGPSRRRGRAYVERLVLGLR